MILHVFQHQIIDISNVHYMVTVTTWSPAGESHNVAVCEMLHPAVQTVPSAVILTLQREKNTATYLQVAFIRCPWMECLPPRSDPMSKQSALINTGPDSGGPFSIPMHNKYIPSSKVCTGMWHRATLEPKSAGIERQPQAAYVMRLHILQHTPLYHSTTDSQLAEVKEPIRGHFGHMCMESTSSPTIRTI